MKKWNQLRDRIPPARRRITDERVAAALKEMPLHRLREARRLTQKQIAEAMRIDQSRVSKIERRTDVYVSTLRNFVSALGGDLELVARFPDGRVNAPVPCHSRPFAHRPNPKTDQTHGTSICGHNLNRRLERAGFVGATQKGSHLNQSPIASEEWEHHRFIHTSLARCDAACPTLQLQVLDRECLALV